MIDLRYPIGKFDPPGRLAPERRTACIEEIAALPAILRRVVAGLSESRLDTEYRPGGWTVRQVVHHLPDSHINAYTRMKIALTEDTPTIRTYEEARWAELPDGRAAPIEISLALVQALHERWTWLLRALTPDQFGRTYHHPDLGAVTLDTGLAMYAWHGRHHVAHITGLGERMGW